MIEAKKAIDLVQGKLSDWIEGLIAMLPNIALAALIVVAFSLAARLARQVTLRLLARLVPGGTLRRLISTMVHLAIVLVGFFTALSVLHLDKTVTSLLAGVGILGLALGFAFQDIASNFIAGVLMAMQRPIRVGELVGTGSHMGVVQRIDLRTTELRNMQGLQVIIPNRDIFQNALVNYTRNGVRRVDLPVGISYAEDLAHVKRVTIEAVKAVPDVLPGPDVDFFYQSFGDSAIQFEVRFWIASVANKHFHSVRSNAIMAIKSAYDREGITIPFPIRTLDFGIKGGAPLGTQLGNASPDTDRTG